MGLSWDALNHHVYLGWTAEQHRFDRDFLAAGYQSFQSPYVNWPLYKLAATGWSGPAAGAVLATLQCVVVWPVWMIARSCMPGSTVFDVAMRLLGVILALLCGVALAAFGSSMNDLLAAVPFAWAVALAVEPIARTEMTPAAGRRYIALSGLCVGIAVAAKLSSGPLATLMPGLWFAAGRGVRGRLTVVAIGTMAAVVGLLAVYGYWGWLLWQRTGNPVYPFYDHYFWLLRAWLRAGG